MGLGEFLLICGFLLSLFVVLGLKRSWRVAAVIWALLALCAVYVWALPAPREFDEQDRMGQAAWQLILLIFVIGGAVAFAGAFGISKARASNQSDRSRESME
jgi:hypothetical protein